MLDRPYQDGITMAKVIKIQDAMKEIGDIIGRVAALVYGQKEAAPASAPEIAPKPTQERKKPTSTRKKLGQYNDNHYSNEFGKQSAEKKNHLAETNNLVAEEEMEVAKGRQPLQEAPEQLVKDNAAFVKVESEYRAVSLILRALLADAAVQSQSGANTARFLSQIAHLEEMDCFFYKILKELGTKPDVAASTLASSAQPANEDQIGAKQGGKCSPNQKPRAVTCL
jgi:hypothetical protein